MALKDVEKKRKELEELGFSLISTVENNSIPLAENPNYTCTIESYKRGENEFRYIIYDKYFNLNVDKRTGSSNAKGKIIYWSNQYLNSEQGKCLLSDSQVRSAFCLFSKEDYDKVFEKVLEKAISEEASKENPLTKDELSANIKKHRFAISDYLISSAKDAIKTYIKEHNNEEFINNITPNLLDEEDTNSKRHNFLNDNFSGIFTNLNDKDGLEKSFQTFSCIGTRACHELIEDGVLLNNKVSRFFDVASHNCVPLREMVKASDDKAAEKLLSDYLCNDKGQLAHISIIREVKNALRSDDELNYKAIGYDLQTLSNYVFNIGTEIGASDNAKKIASRNCVKELLHSPDFEKDSNILLHPGRLTSLGLGKDDRLQKEDYEAVLLYNKKALFNALANGKSFDEAVSRFRTAADEKMIKDLLANQKNLEIRRAQKISDEIEKELGEEINVVETMINLKLKDYIDEAVSGLKTAATEKGIDLTKVGTVLLSRLGEEGYNTYLRACNVGPVPEPVPQTHSR